MTRRSAATASVRIAAVAALSLLAAAACLWARGALGVSVVDGGSMRPALASGDVLVYQRAFPWITAGDIVVFPRRGWPGGVAHRVVAVCAGGMLRTRGDANPIDDRDLLPRTEAMGRVVLTVPTGRAAARVVALVRRWYTHEPIAHTAMTERRLSPTAVTGTGLR